jgi:hypothetical protein
MRTGGRAELSGLYGATEAPRTVVNEEPDQAKWKKATTGSYFGSRGFWPGSGNSRLGLTTPSRKFKRFAPEIRKIIDQRLN